MLNLTIGSCTNVKGGTATGSVGVDRTLTKSGSAADAATTGSKITALTDEIAQFSEAFSWVTPTNVLNPATFQYNKWLYLRGDIVNDNNGTFISEKIPCKKGDVIYLTALNASGKFMAITAVNFRRVLFYTEDGAVSADGGQDYINGYTVTGDDTAYFIPCFAKEISDYVLLAVTFGTYPMSQEDIPRYFNPYYSVTISSETMDEIAGRMGMGVAGKYIVDCWGDSMTERGTPGKPYPEMLQELLGEQYTVNNYGMSSQSSGEVAMRFGTNEVYVTLEGNQIPATTDPVAITSMICSRGDRWTGRNMVNFTPTKSVPCRLNGVSGQFSRTAFTDATFFTRDTAGDAVPVQPGTRLWCENNYSDEHICIFWAGKNDTMFAANYIVDGTVDCIYSMLHRMQHSYFIVLPVLHSISHPYGDGTFHEITAINARLKALYPSNYLDIQSMLMEHGLQDAGLTPTEADLTAIANGTLPPQLMGDDGSHPNDTCRRVYAKYIYDFMVAKKWVNG